MTYLIKFEIRPLRALYNFTVKASSPDEAVEKFKLAKPDAIICSMRVDA